jgi:hypothetical protein
MGKIKIFLSGGVNAARFFWEKFEQCKKILTIYSIKGLHFLGEKTKIRQ